MIQTKRDLIDYLSRDMSFYYCQSKNYWNQVKSLFTGSTRNNVNAEQYAELKIPMCDAKLQHHIVNINWRCFYA